MRLLVSVMSLWICCFPSIESILSCTVWTPWSFPGKSTLPRTLSFTIETSAVLKSSFVPGSKLTGAVRATEVFLVLRKEQEREIRWSAVQNHAAVVGVIVRNREMHPGRHLRFGSDCQGRERLILNLNRCYDLGRAVPANRTLSRPQPTPAWSVPGKPQRTKSFARRVSRPDD